MESQLQTVVFLCRHGQTDKPYSIDPYVDNERVLTEFGQKQIRTVGEYLRSFAPSAIYSSPRRRTLESAEILRETSEVAGKVIERNELLEIYSDSDYASLQVRMPLFFQELLQKHAGEHIICVSHQDVIEGGLRALGVSAEEAEFPCKMGECYRIVFAGPTFVQATKLTPAPQQ
jgi:broad specificity phosphatase PhoE